MAVVNEQSVLTFYLQEMEKDTISFLHGRDEMKAKIKTNIQQLSLTVSMNDKIEVSKRLWKLLFEAAMTYIDPDKRGYDELFQFFDEYVEFEELIFASDSFYRDHTFHCLWVYFLGEYITKTQDFKYLFANFDKTLDYMRTIRSILERIVK